MNNAELIKALRYCAKREICTSETSAECPFTNKWTDGVDCMNALFCDAADALEAADKRIAELEAQLPKEGEWLDEQRDRWIYAKCNLCGKVQDVRSNYCPNCGAKMDGEVNKNE